MLSGSRPPTIPGALSDRPSYSSPTSPSSSVRESLSVAFVLDEACTSSGRPSPESFASVRMCFLDASAFPARLTSTPLLGRACIRSSMSYEPVAALSYELWRRKYGGVPMCHVSTCCAGRSLSCHRGYAAWFRFPPTTPDPRQTPLPSPDRIRTYFVPNSAGNRSAPSCQSGGGRRGAVGALRRAGTYRGRSTGIGARRDCEPLACQSVLVRCVGGWFRIGRVVVDSLTIGGVAADVPMFGLRTPTPPELYIPFSTHISLPAMRVMLRVGMTCISCFPRCGVP